MYLVHTWGLEHRTDKQILHSSSVMQEVYVRGGTIATLPNEVKAIVVFKLDISRFLGLTLNIEVSKIFNYLFWTSSRYASNTTVKGHCLRHYPS